mgnify:CR=1 FL=1
MTQPEGNSRSITTNQTGIHEKLDALVAELKSRGFEFDQEVEDMRYLWREAVLHDPSGNKIKLYWAGTNRLNPPWRVEIGDAITSNGGIQ